MDGFTVSLGSVDQSCLKKYFIDIGMPRSAFLSDVCIGITEDIPNAYLFMREEIIRVMDFCKIANKLGININAELDQRGSAMLVPILRSIVEGLIKSRYIFKSVIKKGAIDNEEINKDFKRICEVFIYNYFRYSEMNGSDDELEKKKNDFLKKICFNSGKDFGLKSISESGDHSDGKPTHNSLYKLYRYCCFYSHGNMNRGITKEVQDPAFNEYIIGSVIESVAHQYLAYLAILCESEEFRGHVLSCFST